MGTRNRSTCHVFDRSSQHQGGPALPVSPPSSLSSLLAIFLYLSSLAFSSWELTNFCISSFRQRKQADGQHGKRRRRVQARLDGIQYLLVMRAEPSRGGREVLENKRNIDELRVSLFFLFSRRAPFLSSHSSSASEKHTFHVAERVDEQAEVQFAGRQARGVQHSCIPPNRQYAPSSAR